MQTGVFTKEFYNELNCVYGTYIPFLATFVDTNIHYDIYMQFIAFRIM